MTIPAFIAFAAYLLIYLILLKKLRFFRESGLSSHIQIAFFLLRISFGLVLTGLYTIYYDNPSKADIYRYFNDAQVINNVLPKDIVAWLKIVTGLGLHDADVYRWLLDTQNFSHPATDPVTNNQFIIRTISLMSIPGLGNIYVTTLLFNCITFTLLIYMYKMFYSFKKEHAKVSMLVLFLMPSFVFWSSGLLKEQIALWGFLLGAVGFINMLTHKQVRYVSLLHLLIGIYLLVMVKWFLLVCAALSVIVWLLLRFYPVNFKSIVIGILAGGMMMYSVIQSGWIENVCSLMITKRVEFVTLAKSERVHLLPLADIPLNSCVDLIKATPVVIAQAMAAPFPYFTHSTLHVLAGVEWFFYLFFLFFSMIRYGRIPEKTKTHLIIAYMVFVLSTLFIIGFVSPITGAIVHYRIFSVTALWLIWVNLVDLAKVKYDFMSVYNLVFGAFKKRFFS